MAFARGELAQGDRGSLVRAGQQDITAPHNNLHPTDDVLAHHRTVGQARHARHHARPAWHEDVAQFDLFGHAPLLPKTQELLDEYAEDSLRAGRYDFRMGRKMARFLGEAGFTVTQAFTVPDRELSFEGPAEDEVLDAWRLRFARMKLLQEFCGSAFASVEEDFLACLAREDHRCSARVQVCLGRLEGGEA